MLQVTAAKISSICAALTSRARTTPPIRVHGCREEKKTPQKNKIIYLHTEKFLGQERERQRRRRGRRRRKEKTQGRFFVAATNKKEKISLMYRTDKYKGTSVQMYMYMYPGGICTINVHMSVAAPVRRLYTMTIICTCVYNVQSEHFRNKALHTVTLPPAQFFKKRSPKSHMYFNGQYM